jgi:hypothetical protein
MTVNFLKGMFLMHIVSLRELDCTGGEDGFVTMVMNVRVHDSMEFIDQT